MSLRGYIEACGTSGFLPRANSVPLPLKLQFFSISKDESWSFSFIASEKNTILFKKKRMCYWSGTGQVATEAAFFGVFVFLWLSVRAERHQQRLAAVFCRWQTANLLRIAMKCPWSVYSSASEPVVQATDGWQRWWMWKGISSPSPSASVQLSAVLQLLGSPTYRNNNEYCSDSTRRRSILVGS